MTRINVVSPKILSGKHLVGEWHEIWRMYGYVDGAKSRAESIFDKRNPAEYTLGTGHVRFFYPRMHFIWRRHVELYMEMCRRGFKCSALPEPGAVLKQRYSRFWGGYTVTDEAIRINMARLRERGGHYPDGIEWQHRD